MGFIPAKKTSNNDKGSKSIYKILSYGAMNKA
jgi:hypothetical protein